MAHGRPDMDMRTQNIARLFTCVRLRSLQKLCAGECGHRFLPDEVLEHTFILADELVYLGIGQECLREALDRPPDVAYIEAYGFIKECENELYAFCASCRYTSVESSSKSTALVGH